MSQTDRKNPFLSCLLERTRLSKNGSTKKTFHLSLTLEGSAIAYQPGDSIGIFPKNHPEEVDAILDLFQKRGLDASPFRDFLIQKANLQKAHPALIRAVSSEFPEPPHEFFTTLSPANLLTRGQKISFSPEQIPQLFLPLLPRFYSAASSPLFFPQEVHLLVKQIEYMVDDTLHKGVATRYLCEDAIVGQTPIALYLQPSCHFYLPTDTSASIIFVAAGCGMAPFRGFMQHRMATQAKGRNWFFFGERNYATDFYYQDFWEDLQKQDMLRLDLAFSRDTPEKIFVQNRLWEERQDLWAWIQEGAYFYVCGDAHRMAKEVEETFRRIVISEGGLSKEEAHHFVAKLRSENRYCTDIY
jgi:sulfite reductase (NADPH) flavoprotein alpha-component